MKKNGNSSSSRFGHFLVLPENRLAFTAAMNWATDPETGPVYLYGPSGIGKSHLAVLASQRLEEIDPDLRQMQVTASTFSADLTDAVNQNAVRKFQRRYRDVDIVLIEDLQALERRPESQQQLLALIDYWEAHTVRMLFTARKPPGQLEGFLPRLGSRLRAAATLSLKNHNLSGRRQLIQQFTHDRGLVVSENVVDLLARESASPRELLGMVMRLEVYARQIRAPLDVSSMEKFLQNDPPPPRLTTGMIARTVARHFGISLVKMRSAGREQVLVLPRQCAMYLARELSSDQTAKIGNFFSGRDHSTVVRACQKLETQLPEDPELRQHLEQIRIKLGLNV